MQVVQADINLVYPVKLQDFIRLLDRLRRFEQQASPRPAVYIA